MTTKRTRGQRLRIGASGLTEAKRTQLLFGWNYFNQPAAYPEEKWPSERFTPSTLARMQIDWMANRKALLDEYEKSHPFGDLPWAARMFDPQPVRFKPQIETR